MKTNVLGNEQLPPAEYSLYCVAFNACLSSGEVGRLQLGIVGPPPKFGRRTETDDRRSMLSLFTFIQYTFPEGERGQGPGRGGEGGTEDQYLATVSLSDGPYILPPTPSVLGAFFHLRE